MGPLAVKFWGTRGLISSPRPQTVVFGGNTPALQILHRDHLILVDSGFGCTNWGDELMHTFASDGRALTVHIFYTHFHWDHVQGLPFFKPIYLPSTTLHLYSPEAPEAMLQSLDILFDGSYSPFQSLMSMQAKIHLHQLRGPLTFAGGLNVDYCPVDHGEAAHQGGLGVFAYKFASDHGGSVCLITDHEAGPTERNAALVAWAKGTDLLIHDGQFKAEEAAERRGWGHSTVQGALLNALAIGADLTLLTHHDPARDDRQIVEMHRSLLRDPRFRHLRFDFAREEMIYAAHAAKPLIKLG